MVSFDSYGRRQNYTLYVLEHRLDNEMFKVTEHCSSSTSRTWV